MTTTRGQHLIGKTLGSCVLEKLLGYGGSSAVFLAQQYNPERKVAIKVFLPRFNMDKQMQRDFYARFLREAEAASQLDHPNILPIYSYGEQDGLPYIIMPYMSGGTLSEYITKHGPLSLSETQWYLEQIASALDYAHDEGCIHCDVKPANLLLDDEERVLLSDFGIAHMIRDEDLAGQPMIKATEALMGTPDYISPEQALGQPLDGRSDIYSLGVTIFYLLAKQLPFKADNTLALALLHIHEAPPSLALLRIDISPTIDRIVQKALAKEPDARFQTAGEFSSAFAHAVEMSELVNPPISDGMRAIASVVPTNNRAPAHQSAPQPSFTASQPVVRVTPMSARASRIRRFVGIGAAFAALLVLMLVASSFVISRLHGSPVGSTNSTSTSLTSGIHPDSTDYLANHNDWPNSSTFFYKDNQYHIQNTSNDDVALAPYTNHQFSNFRLSVTTQEIKNSHNGADFYGVVFRSTSDQSHYYLFEISTTGNGQYVFWRYDGQWKTLAAGLAPTLVATPNTSNILTIEVHDNTFSFSINGKSVGSPVSDNSKPQLSVGAIGLYVEDEGAEVAFWHLYINSLK